MDAQEIIHYLKKQADPENAKQAQRYFKTAKGEYGYGDKFLGIRVPVIRQAVKKFNNTPLGVAKTLLTSKFHEIRLFALLILVSRFSNKNLHEQDKIFHLYLKNTRYINNWDLVDSSAHHIIGAYLEDKDRSLLLTLAKSELLWERRIAIIATYYFIKNNQYHDTLLLCEILINDPEDLIHKATGWMLREVGKRDLATEVKFLKKHYKKMPRTMLRYAIEKFSKEERSNYLTGKV